MGGFLLVDCGIKDLNEPSFSFACSMSSSGSEGNMAVIHLCLPLLSRHKTIIRGKPQQSSDLWECFLLCVRFEQDLMFELLAVTQLQVEDEA